MIRSDELNADTAQALAALEPFGSGNPRPRLLLVDAIIEEAQTTRNGLHMRCRVSTGGVKLSAVGFGMGQRTDIVGARPQSRLVGAQLRADEWQGNLRPQLVLERVGYGRVAPEEVVDSWDCGHCHEKEAVAASAPPLGDSSAGESQVSKRPPVLTHDLRDSPGLVTALAQVLATQERTVVLVCSAAHSMSELHSRLPLELFGGEGLVCVNRSCAMSAGARIAAASVAIVEWDAAGQAMEAVVECAHTIALDPPFRESHQRLLSHAGERGSNVHLLYGEEERNATAQLLRYVLHPRFAMVCLYRAMGETDSDPSQVFSRAAGMAWKEGRVVLTVSGILIRAQGILGQLGLERTAPGKAKLEARNNAAYREAEAEYEECLRLCLTR